MPVARANMCLKRRTRTQTKRSLDLNDVNLWLLGTVRMYIPVYTTCVIYWVTQRKAGRLRMHAAQYNIRWEAAGYTARKRINARPKWWHTCEMPLSGTDIAFGGCKDLDGTVTSVLKRYTASVHGAAWNVAQPLPRSQTFYTLVGRQCSPFALPYHSIGLRRALRRTSQ